MCDKCGCSDKNDEKKEKKEDAPREEETKDSPCCNPKKPCCGE